MLNNNKNITSVNTYTYSEMLTRVFDPGLRTTNVVLKKIV